MIIDGLTLSGIIIFLLMTGILLKVMLRDQKSCCAYKRDTCLPSVFRSNQ